MIVLITPDGPFSISYNCVLVSVFVIKRGFTQGWVVDTAATAAASLVWADLCLVWVDALQPCPHAWHDVPQTPITLVAVSCWQLW